jgi:hypothetical protein
MIVPIGMGFIAAAPSRLSAQFNHGPPSQLVNGPTQIRLLTTDVGVDSLIQAIRAGASAADEDCLDV